MIKIASEDFDIAKIAGSGQCFRMNESGDSCYLMVAANRLLRLEFSDGESRLYCSQKEFDEIWKAYFDFDTDYRAIRESVSKEDSYLFNAMQYGRGIRILRQDPWEMLISFIISQRKNIPAIKRSIELLCEACGERITSEAGSFYAFPSPERLAEMSAGALNACSLGYRTKYIQKTAGLVANKEIDLEALRKASDEELLSKLLTIPGVGPKVANCVMLFGYHRLSSFPRDVWMNRVIDGEYDGSFPLDLYPGYQGVMQQYLFYYARSNA